MNNFKTEFLASLSDKQLGLFYAHEYDQDLDEQLMDELTTIQYQSFRIWKMSKTTCVQCKRSEISEEFRKFREESLTTNSNLMTKFEEMGKKLDVIEKIDCRSRELEKKMNMLTDFIDKLNFPTAKITPKVVTNQETQTGDEEIKSIMPDDYSTEKTNTYTFWRIEWIPTVQFLFGIMFKVITFPFFAISKVLSSSSTFAEKVFYSIFLLILPGLTVEVLTSFGLLVR